MIMNYSVFKLQSQSGKPGIFWEKETIPKNDRKFGYKKRNQRFSIRRHPGDRGHVDTDLVSLTPDEPPAPPPKPAKNFIKRNKEKLAAKGKPEGPSTVTLTQEQLNAILRSVGKVAGGHKNAIKISIDKKNDKNEITVESPRRRKDDGDYSDRDDNDEYEERREKRRSKKRPDTKEEDESAPGSIYALLNDSKTKPKNTSDRESYDSDESLRIYRREKPRRKRKDRQSRRKYDDDYDDQEDKVQKSRSRKTYNNDDDDVDDDRDVRKRRTKSKNNRKYASDDEEEELVEIRNLRNRSKPKYVDDKDDHLDDEKENKKRIKNTKKRDDSYEDDIDNREIERRERTRKYDKSRKDDHSVEKRDRSEKRDKARQVSKERDLNAHNISGNKTDDENLSPRDKIGVPNELSWRHMSKAERKRLETARQKMIDEEEKREEERIRQLQAKYGGGVTAEPKRMTRSDPATRLDRPERGRETDLSNRTDHYRRDPRSLSPIDRSPDRSPEVLSHLSPDTSPKVMPIPKRHLTLAEKKRLEWERERVESQLRERQEVDPWGRPGAGAPLRTKSGHVAAEYRGRQENMKSITIEEEPGEVSRETDNHPPPPRENRRSRHHSPPLPAQPQQTSQIQTEGENLPHAMRSSFILGQAAPDYDKFNETKEKERKQWLAELEKQIEDKKASEMKLVEDSKVADTWADKLGVSHRPVQLPEQPRAPPATDVYGLTDRHEVPVQDSHRTSSAPGDLDESQKASELKLVEDSKVADTWADKLGVSHRPVQLPEQPRAPPATDMYGLTDRHEVPVQDTHRTSSAPGDLDESQTYIRGQNAPIDPVTKKELEEKRRKYLEHQMAVKAQVEEKERLKKMERERKMKEDMEEERKLQAERDLLQKQFESEQQKMRQKEAQRQAQVNQLKAAMDEAHAKALQEKYQRKMQHLEAGGHDTTKLREHLEGEITSRIELLHTRRERDVQRAQQILDLQYWGLNKIEEEGQGHEENAKITPRSDPPNTGVIHVAPTHVPGLDLSTARTNLPQLPDNKWETGRTTNHPQFHDTKREPDHEPYVEDRVLTPSRFRHPSKPWSDPSSPRREFGTQTGNQNETASELDVNDVANLLNAGVPREESEVQIEYRMDKRVRVVSAPKESVQKRQPEKRTSRSKDRSPYREQSSPHQHHHEVQKRREQLEAEKRKRLEDARRKGPVKPGSRPKWGYKNMDNKKPRKNSEKDPFYEQKKRESQMRRYQREQKLLAMVEANKEVIPKYYVPPPKSRDQSPYSDYEHDSIREARVSRRSKSHSPHRTLSEDRADYYDDMSKLPNTSTSRRKTSRSPPRERVDSPTERQSRTRHKSPPIPAIKHRNEVNQNYAGVGESRRVGGKYGDPVQQPNEPFVPFTRTIDVLDPARADDPLPLSREATQVANARKQYFENLHPDKYGNRQTLYQDAERNPLEPKNPLMNPSLVLEHPTSRQDQILIQLSTLKQSLMQRQRELETFSPSDLEKQDIPVH